jgi:SNF2 family DNA or RNA helicase
MGVGITLTAAARAIFVEQDWTPAILRQAESELHSCSLTLRDSMRHVTAW